MLVQGARHFALLRKQFSKFQSDPIRMYLRRSMNTYEQIYP